MSLIFFYIILIFQIILESLPISSSGHLKIVESIWNLLNPDSIIKLNKSLEYILHGPTLIVLSVFLYDKLINKINFNDFFYLLISIVVADSITVLIYFFLSYIDVSFFKYFFGFLITLISLISLKFAPYGAREFITLKDAIIIGFVQGISLLPGISRLASTIVAACWLGINIKTAFIFTCLIQFPLVVAGFSKGIFEFFVLEHHSLSYLNLNLFFVVILISSVISYYCLNYIYLLASNEQLYKFAYYMIVPIVVSLYLGI